MSVGSHLPFSIFVTSAASGRSCDALGEPNQARVWANGTECEVSLPQRCQYADDFWATEAEVSFKAHRKNAPDGRESLATLPRRHHSKCQGTRILMDAPPNGHPCELPCLRVATPRGRSVKS